MILEMFILSLGVLTILLFFNFFPKKDKTQATYGVLAGAWSIVLGFSILATGITLPTGELQTFDQQEDVDGGTTVINGTINITKTYSTQNTGVFNYNTIFGIFLLAGGMFAFMGNVMRFVPTNL